MNIKFRIGLAPERAITIAMLCTLFVFTQPTWAQNPVTYNFSGNVRSLNEASSIFAGVGIGAPVQGQFTIDYGAIDTAPSLSFGSYQSLHVGFSGLIGGHVFASAPALFNTVNVDDGDPVERGDFLVFAVQSGAPAELSWLQLTLYDSAGQTLTGDALPGSAAAFDAFPDLVIYGMSPGGFGQYVCDVAITPVPEPSSMALFGIAGVALVAWRWRKYQ